MRKLDRLVIGTFIGPFILTFFITLFIFEMQFLWKYIEDLVGKGLGTWVIIKLLIYASASLVPMALPLATLLSSIMTFGNLGENNELVAMKSAGISLPRIMRPVFGVVLILSVGAFFFSNNLLPRSNLKFKSLLYDVIKKKPAMDFKPGVFYEGMEGVSIRVSGKSESGDRLYKVLIYTRDKGGGNRKVISAEEGEIFNTPDGGYLVMKLYNGNSYEELSGVKMPHTTTRFKEHQIFFDLSGFELKKSDEDLFKSNQAMLNIGQLSEVKDSLVVKRDARIEIFKESISKRFLALSDTLNEPIDSITVPSSIEDLPNELKKSVLIASMNISRASKTYSTSMGAEVRGRNRKLVKYDIEWHRKFTVSMACLLFFFIGAPLGAIIRKGGLGMPVVVSIFFFLVFHITSMTGEKMVKNLDIPAWSGIWAAVAILFPMGIFLSYKATTDSVLFDSTYYAKLAEPFKSKVWKPFIALLVKKKKKKHQ